MKIKVYAKANTQIVNIIILKKHVENIVNEVPVLILDHVSRDTQREKDQKVSER